MQRRRHFGLLVSDLSFELRTKNGCKDHGNIASKPDTLPNNLRETLRPGFRIQVPPCAGHYLPFHTTPNIYHHHAISQHSASTAQDFLEALVKLPKRPTGRSMSNNRSVRALLEKTSANRSSSGGTGRHGSTQTHPWRAYN